MPGSDWYQSIFNCFQDGIQDILCVWCGCTSCYLAQIRAAYDNSNYCFNILCLNIPIVFGIIREGYGIDGTCVGDIR